MQGKKKEQTWGMENQGFLPVATLCRIPMDAV